MKNFLTETFNACKKLEISNNYDCKTELKSSDGKEPCFVFHMKGNYTIKPIHIAVGAAAVAGVCIITSATTAIRRKSCCKKA